jgi:peptidyl-prolyl cis-trans isomerase D
MALFAFVISGVFGSNTSGSDPSEPIAIVNDEDIEVGFFRQLVEQTERNYNLSTLQAVNSVWDQLLRVTIFKQEFDHLGIDAGKQQIEMILLQNEAIVQDPRFQNETGFFDFGIFTDFINQIKLENPQAYDSWRSQEESIIGLAKENIYFDLIKSSTGFTEIEGKDAYHLENDKINMKYVSVPFNDIPDSLFKISDAEIRKYISQNIDDYTKDASRGISYVKFDEQASAEDKNQIRAELEMLLEQRVEYNDVSKLTDTIEGLKTVKNITEFVSRYSEITFDSIYLPKGKLANDYADILFDLSPGKVFGPYKDGNEFKISRLIDRKDGGSVRASHILITYQGAERASPEITRTKEEASIFANELYRKVRRDVESFGSFAAINSDGPSKSVQGDLGFFQEGAMTEKFFDFCNKSNIGKIGLVETDFGFHIINVTDKEDVVLLANVSKQIVPSESTSNIVFKETTQFEIEAINTKDFSGVARKSNLTVRPVENINILEENLPGLLKQRNIVKWAFEEDTKVGSVRRFSLATGGYAVVQLTKITPEGEVDVESFKTEIAAVLINDKKAAYIQEKYVANVTLETLAKATDREVETASAVTQKNTVLAGSGTEPYVIGSAFSLDINKPSALVQGNDGVYMVEVTSKDVAAEMESYTAYANALQIEENLRINNTVYEALRSASEIDDNRKIYY